MRRTFKSELYKQMTLDKDIVVIVMDLGFGMFDAIKKDYSSRFFNVGASEQAGMDIAVGMALSGKKPFVYSITPFLIYRPFETLRTYIHNEDIPVRLVAAGRGEDYEIDGISHQSNDVRKILDCLPDIEQHFPMDKKEIPNLVSKMVKVNTAQFISLRR